MVGLLAETLVVWRALVLCYEPESNTLKLGFYAHRLGLPFTLLDRVRLTEFSLLVNSFTLTLAPFPLFMCSFLIFLAPKPNHQNRQ